MKRLLTAILIAGSAGAAMADGLKSLESFMKNAQAGKADFTQSVTSPPKSGQEARTKVSSGSFEFQRPASSVSTTPSLSSSSSWPTARRCGCTTPT
jgi:outer membrane lipoprotein carrier protein